MNDHEYRRVLMGILFAITIVGIGMWLVPARFTGPRFDLTAIILMAGGAGLNLTWLICEPREFVATIRNRPDLLPPKPRRRRRSRNHS
jgi:hypothetical protein